MAANSDNVVIDAAKQVIRCNVCGEEKALQLPMLINELVKWCKGFSMMHRHKDTNDN